jgi:hypothetical protein
MQFHDIDNRLRTGRKAYAHACGENLGETVEPDNPADLRLVKFQLEVRQRPSGFSKI